METENMMYFRYLNRLRESGAVNMFGASEYLREAFDLDKATARKVLSGWMQWVNANPENLNR